MDDRSTIARARRGVEDLPRLMRGGLVLAASGAVIDIAYHLGSDAPGLGHGSVAFIGHLVTLIGMAVTMLGLIFAAVAHRAIPVRPLQKGQSR